MQAHLRCDCCGCQVPSNFQTTTPDVLEQISAEGPWFAIGDGETLEDRLYDHLTTAGAIRCPECGASITPSEELLGSMSRELLGQW